YRRAKQDFETCLRQQDVLKSYAYRRAKQDFETCLLGQRNASEKAMAPIRVVAGVIDEASGNHSGVIKRLEGVNDDLLPVSHQVIRNQLLGDAYYGRGDLDRALEFYREALWRERSLFSPVIRARLGRVYRDRGEPEKAVELCELALKEVLEDMDMVPDKGREDIGSWIQNLESNRDRIPVFNIQPLSEILISMGSLDLFSKKAISGKSLFDQGVELGRQEVEERKAFSNKVPDAGIDLFAGIRKEVLLVLADEALQSEDHAFWGKVIEALGKTGGRDTVDYLLHKAELPFLKGEKGLESLQNLLCALLWTRESRAWEQVDRVMAGLDKRSRKKVARGISKLKKELGRDEERAAKAEEAEEAREAREAEENERLRKEREAKKAEKAREAKEAKARNKAYRAAQPAVMEILGPEQVDAVIDEEIQQGALEGIETALAIRAVDALSDRYIKYHRLIGEQRDEIAEKLIREHLSLPDILETLDKGAPATGWKQTVEVSTGELYLVEFNAWEKYEDFGPEVILEVRNPEIDRGSLSKHKERLKEALVDSGIYQRWSEAELETIGGNFYPGTEEDQGAYDDRWQGVMDLFSDLFTEISIEMGVKGDDTLTAPKKTTMKAPGSLSVDEDTRIDTQYITGLVSKA
ncbi:MAG: tetratricopeptide repeat protein, partial [Candidatus Omnitrophica bacterium]|nr:tetratricopeptide repeat protein [Candidatus Omnitrophota bacterium]